MTAVLSLAGVPPRQLQLAAEHRTPTLDQLIGSLWERLATQDTVECPVCAGHMEREYGAGARPIGARCADCGSSLS